MPPIKEPVSNEFNQIELKSQETIVFQNLEFLLESFVKILEIEFFFWIFMEFLTQVFLFGTFLWWCKISGQTNKMPWNESKNNISPEKYWDFALFFTYI